MFDGVAYLSELEGSRDACILEADGSEGIFTAELDVDMRRVAAPRHALEVCGSLELYLALAPPVAALFRAHSRVRGSALSTR